MKLLLGQGARETSLRRTPFLLSEIPSNATHLSFYGDISSVEEDPNDLMPSLPWVFSRKTNAPLSSGVIRLPDGFGPKVVRVEAVLPAGFPIPQGIFSTIAGAPPVYLWTPPNPAWLKSKWVGRSITATSGATVRLLSISGGDYVITAPLTLAPTEEVWFDEELLIEEVSDAIHLVSLSSFSLPEYGDSHIDLSGFWEGVRDFWTNLEEPDRLLVESNWRGLAQQHGQLLQRFYEIDASESIQDMLRYRRHHWAKIDTRYTVFENSGKTDTQKPNRWIDTIHAPFTVPLDIDRDEGDQGRFVTVSGKAYNIASVPSEEFVLLENGPSITMSGQSYALGGQYAPDLSEVNRFHAWIDRSFLVFLDGDEWNDLPLQQIVRVLGGTEPSTALRVRNDPGVYTPLTVQSATPSRMESSHPLFSHALYGVDVRIRGARYWIVDVDPNGFWVDLDRGVPAGTDYTMECLSLDHSLFRIGSLSAGSRVFQAITSSSVFHPSDVGLAITIRTGTQRGTYSISRVLDAQTVELDQSFSVTEGNLEFVVPCDLLADCTLGRMRRMPAGRCPAFSRTRIQCTIYTPYRVFGDDRLASLPVLQEWTHDALSSQTDAVEGKASTLFYLGHQSVLSLSLWNTSDQALVEGEDYILFSDTGFVSFFDTDRIRLGDSFSGEVSFQPWIGKESVDFFVEGKWIYFRAIPQVVLWAPDVYFNHEDPYKLFGSLIDFYGENNTAYYYGLLALWSSYWMGPRRSRLEQAVYVLMGLPFSEKKGIVSSVVTRYIGQQKQDLVTIAYENGATQEKWIPSGLRAIVVEGQVVDLFHPLAGFHFLGSGNASLRGNRLEDTDASLFLQSMVDGWVSILGNQGGVYRIRKFIDERAVRLETSFDDEDDVRFTVFVPAVRLFDQSNYPGFLQALVSKDSLEKYMLPQATDAEYQIAQKILENALFYVQIPFESFTGDTHQSMSDILRNLLLLKPTYTDFIFQLLMQEEDELLFLDDDAIGVSFDIDLTSRLSWEAGTQPLSIDAIQSFLGTSIPTPIRAATIFGQAEIIHPNLLRDTVQSPFSLDMVGDTLWLGYGVRFLDGLGVAPAIHPQLVYSNVPTFTQSDVGSFLFLSGFNAWMKIVRYETPMRVYVDRRFSSPFIFLRGLLSDEPNTGTHTQITAVHSPHEVTVLPNLTPSSKIAYVWIPKERSLDSESLLFESNVDVAIYDGSMALLRYYVAS